MADVAVRAVGTVVNGVDFVSPGQSVPIPAGTQIGDLMLLVFVPNTYPVALLASGWTVVDSNYALVIMKRYFQSGDTDPTAYTLASNDGAACIISFYNVDPSTPLDVAVNKGSFSAPGDDLVTILGFNTNTDGAMAVFAWFSVDDNSWAYYSGGHTQLLSINKTADIDRSLGFGVLSMPTAGGTGDQIEEQTAKGGDAGIWYTFAIKPGSTGIAGTISGSCAQVTGAVAGVVKVAGAIAANAAQVTGAIAGAVAITGVIAAGCPPVTASVVGGHAPITGSIDADVAAAIGVVSGAVLVAGGVTADIVAASGAVVGAVLLSGDIAATVAPIMASVVGSHFAEQITGVVAATVSQATGTIVGGVLIAGSVGGVVTSATAVVEGAALIVGSLDANLSQITGAIIGAVFVTGLIAAPVVPTTTVVMGQALITSAVAANMAQILAAIGCDVAISGSTAVILAATSALVEGVVAPTEVGYDYDYSFRYK